MQVKFDLSDWQNRKTLLLPILDDAARAGLVPAEGTEKLGEFLLGRGVGVALPQAVADPDATGLDTPRAAEPASPVEESEAPRFIRGFHDILITIGIIVVLVGFGGLASVYAVIPAGIVLAEILVRRQRLALPAVTLTAAILFAVAMGTIPLWEGLEKTEEDWILPGVLAIITFTAFLVYWRYKVPLALAAGFVGLFGTIVAGCDMAIRRLSGDPGFFQAHPTGVVFLLGLYAVLVFGTALRFDIGDRHRVTRRSDVAFWMHLAAAPLILYTIMAQIYLGNAEGWFTTQTSLWQAFAIAGTVVLLMLIGIVLDRRAFVTSGLLSFGYAFKVLLTEGGFRTLFASADTLVFLTFLAIGLVVLSLGIGWQPLRRHMLGILPESIRDVVPPVRG